MGDARKIVTSCQYPPIPDRRWDWCAFYDEEEEAGNYGYGATEAEAIADFIENYAADHDERLDGPVPDKNPKLLATALMLAAITSTMSLPTNKPTDENTKGRGK